MSLRNGGIFPLVERETPLADRLRNRVAQRKLGEAIGRRIGMFLKEEDPEQKAEAFDKMNEELKKGLASELDIDPQFISDNLTEKLAELFIHTDPEEIITDEGKTVMGMGTAEESDESEGDDDEDEEEEEESSFASS